LVNVILTEVSHKKDYLEELQINRKLI